MDYQNYVLPPRVLSIKSAELQRFFILVGPAKETEQIPIVLKTKQRIRSAEYLLRRTSKNSFNVKARTLYQLDESIGQPLSTCKTECGMSCKE
jgi:hypothetical protein